MRKYSIIGLLLVLAAVLILHVYAANYDISTKSRSDYMKYFENAVIVEFPLRGEWMAPTTPAKKIPSHGTDQLGERFAYDFLQVDWESVDKPFYNTNRAQYLFFGVPLKDCYCWGKEIYAPCDGEIIKAEDGYEERQRAHWISDSLIAIKNAYSFDPVKDGIQSVAGNYVIMKCRNNVYAAFAHLQNGSIAVSSGQTVKTGDILGKVGHSGNSTSPHLHFQLMDSSNLLSAKGIPCAFERYEVYQNGGWKTVHNGVPSDKDRIRFIK